MDASIMGKLFCFVLVFLAISDVVKLQQDLYCDHPVDIAILIDTSSFFGEENFQEVKNFAKIFIGNLKLSEHRLGPHVAFLTYNKGISSRRKTINFRYSSSVSRLSRTIDSRLSYNGKPESNLDYALSGARNILFQTNMGYRTWVPHVILAITGSWETWTRDARARVQHEARELRESGFQLLVASVGEVSLEDRRMFESLVATKDDLFMVRYVFGLVQVARNMVQRVCPVQRIHPCNATVDIAFIVDSSGSINYFDYDKTKYFVYSIANALNVTENGAHAGVVIYSTHAELVIKFTDHTNIRDFQKAVYALKHMRQFTRIDLGLTTAQMLLFSPLYGGARTGVKQLAFILTDGKQNPDKNDVAVSVAAAAKPLMDANIKTISIGIGSDVNKDELRAMVEFDEDVILAANFDELLRKMRNISEQICEEIIYSKCDYPADFAFMLDTSTNVHEADFTLQKSFVRTMAKLFRIFEFGSRGSVIVFGDQANVAIPLDAHKEYRGFIDAVSGLVRAGGRRRTALALELAEDELMDYDGGARRKVPKVLLLLTAGPESDARDAARVRTITRRLHDRHMLVMVVGIGPDLVTAELVYMVQNSVSVFLAKSFSDLKDQLAPLSSHACREIGPGECNRSLDLAFLLDCSGSITSSEYNEAKTFIKKLIGTFSIYPNMTRIALAVYSDDARVISKLGEIPFKIDVFRAVDRLPHHRGKTRIDLALKLAADQIFTAGAGMRNSAAKAVIVLTDGRQTPAPDGIGLDEAAAILLKRGVKVLSVGIGDHIDQAELDMMVEDPASHTFSAYSYRALRVQLATIARESCDLQTYTGE